MTIQHNPVQKTTPCVNKKKRTCYLVNFTVPTDHRVKMKESKKVHKCLKLVRKLKKLWNMKVTVIPNVVSALRSFQRFGKKDWRN